MGYPEMGSLSDIIPFLNNKKYLSIPVEEKGVRVFYTSSLLLFSPPPLPPSLPHSSVSLSSSFSSPLFSLPELLLVPPPL